MRVAVYGGSFDPPHLGHQEVLGVVAKCLEPDAVLVVPTFFHAFGKQSVPFKHRLEMARLAFTSDLANTLGEKKPVVRVTDIEQTLGMSRSFHTLSALREFYSLDTEFRLVVGADILGETEKWYRWDAVRVLAPPFVVGREGYPGGDTPPLPNYSSTSIRARLAAGEKPQEVPPAVRDYIRQHRLYGSP